MKFIETRKEGEAYKIDNEADRDKVPFSNLGMVRARARIMGARTGRRGLLTCVSLFLSFQLLFRDNINSHQPSEHFDLIQYLFLIELISDRLPHVLQADEGRSAGDSLSTQSQD